MAERRMFAKSIVNSDSFLDMPLTTQALYFHLGMVADDDGFVNSPKRVARMIGCNEEDIETLVDKKFLLRFESGIVVIKHWKMNNYIQKDRYKETNYFEEKSRLKVNDNNAYTLMDADCIQDVYNTDTQYRLGKYRLGKNRVGKSSCLEEPTDLLDKLNIDELRMIFKTYENANDLIDEVQDEVKRKKKVIDHAYKYIVGYAHNKAWSKKKESEDKTNG